MITSVGLQISENYSTLILKKNKFKLYSNTSKLFKLAPHICFTSFYPWLCFLANPAGTIGLLRNKKAVFIHLNSNKYIQLNPFSTNGTNDLGFLGQGSGDVRMSVGWIPKQSEMIYARIKDGISKSCWKCRASRSLEHTLLLKEWRNNNDSTEYEINEMQASGMEAIVSQLTPKRSLNIHSKIQSCISKYCWNYGASRSLQDELFLKELVQRPWISSFLE